MMTELGHGGDPRTLVPGEPETVEAEAAALAAHGRCAEQTGQRLRTIDVAGWSGSAADSFATAWAAQPPTWLKVADSLAAAAGALAGYATTLRWAQGQAAAAVELWDRGARREAQERLAWARRRLSEAGDLAARAITGGGVGAPLATGGPGRAVAGALGALLDAVTGLEPTAGASASGPNLATGKLGELKAFANLGQGTGEGALRVGELALSGKVEGSVGTEAAAAGSIVDGQPQLGAGARAGAYAAGEGTARYHDVAVHGSASGALGAGVQATAAVGRSGADLGGEAYLGGKAEARVGADVGGIGVGVRAIGLAGLGITGHAAVELEDGKVHLAGHAGAAVGLGGATGWDVVVDPDRVQDTAMRAADAVGRGVEQLDREVDEGLAEAREAASRLGRQLDPCD